MGLASRQLNGKGRGWVAALLVMGTFPSVQHAHMLVTDLALLAGYALGLYGLLLSAGRPVVAGLLCGTGAGIALMAKGLLGPGLLGVTALLLPLFKPWRQRSYWIFLGLTAVAALPWLLVWPLLLYQRSPALFHEWFWVNNVGRFVGSNQLAPKTKPFYYLTLLPWFTWPLFPLGLWTLWKERCTGFRTPELRFILLALVVVLGVLSASRQGREIYAMPMLLPLAFLAARRLDDLPPAFTRRASVSLSVFFSVLGVALWLGWQAQFTGFPAAIMERIQAEYPGYVPGASPVLVVVASLASACWLMLVRSRKVSPARLAVRWTAGVALAYLLGMTLWLPLAEWHMSYRDEFTRLKAALPPGGTPVGSRGLGEPQRAMLHYYADLKTWREESRDIRSCRWLLVESRVGHDPVGGRPGPPWRMVWEGRHNRELFELFTIAPVSTASP